MKDYLKHFPECIPVGENNIASIREPPDLKVPRMEGIKQTAVILNLPVHFVRSKVASGEVVAVRAGRRILVNVDKFIEYLNGSTIQAESEKATRVMPIGK